SLCLRLPPLCPYRSLCSRVLLASRLLRLLLFFSSATHTTDLSTLSLHDALPILHIFHSGLILKPNDFKYVNRSLWAVIPDIPFTDRKSTRLNSSHVSISYAVFGLTKKIRSGASFAGTGWAPPSSAVRSNATSTNS